MGSPTTPAAYAAGYATVFQTQNIAPPNAIYFSPDDQLFLYVVPSVVCTLRVIVRYLLPTGELKVGEYDVITSATRTPQLQIQNLGEGFILGINVYCHTQALRRGQCWVKFVLVRGGLNTQILSQTICQGYVSEYTSLFFPNGPGGTELDGHGNVRTILGTTPAPGVDLSETVPAGAIWAVRLFGFTLTTSATAGLRAVQVSIDDGTNVIGYINSNASIGPGITGFYLMGEGFPQGLLIANTVNFPFPVDLLLPAGYRIRTSTGALAAGDQYGAVRYVVEEWLQP